MRVFEPCRDIIVPDQFLVLTFSLIAWRHDAVVEADIWQSRASKPDICNKELTPSAIRMCVKPISCRETDEDLKWRKHVT